MRACATTIGLSSIERWNDKRFRLLRSVYSCNVFIQKNKLENQKQFVVTHDCHTVAYINIVCTQLQRFNNVVEFNAYIQYIGYRS